MPLVRRAYRALYADSLPKDYFESFDEPRDHALFAAGCFWGVEKVFREAFDAHPGFLDLTCVYTGDAKHAHPIDTHLGLHAEAVLIRYDRRHLAYEALVEHFFRTHDPTQRNAQGNDVGSRYRSSIWTFSTRQDVVAKTLRTRTSLHYETRVDGQHCVTKILPADRAHIWTAERRHQRYLERHPQGYHCHTHYLRDHISLNG